MARRRATGSARRPWISLGIQGWRVELGLFAISFFVLLAADLIAAWGPYFVLGCVGVVLWLRPDLRHRYEVGVVERRNAHRIALALEACEILGRAGTAPTVLSTEVTQVGLRFQLRLPPGLHVELLEAAAPVLAAALSARKVLVSSHAEDAGLVTLTEVIADPLPEVIASPLVSADSVDLWQPIPCGMAEDGRAVSLQLVEHNLLLGGEPGAGKSVALSSIVAAAALDPTVSLSLFDAKLVELAPWRHAADHFVGTDVEQGIEVLEHLRSSMEVRYELLLESGARKLSKDSDFGLHVVVIDELALYLRGGTKPQRDRFAELLRDLIARGRAAGIIVVAATQKPSHDVVPTSIRDLFSYRLAMRCSSNDASDTILGQGWASRDYSAASIAPANRGVGYLLAEGGVPVLIKTPHLSDAEIAAVARRAVNGRPL